MQFYLFPKFFTGIINDRARSFLCFDEIPGFFDNTAVIGVIIDARIAVVFDGILEIEMDVGSCQKFFGPKLYMPSNSTLMT